MSQRIKELDGIRGIAILMVLVWHYVTCQQKAIVPGSLLSYLHLPTRGFWSGVDLFFVLSGFLIGGIILDHHRKDNFLRVFWVRRVCRIIPVLVALLIACWSCEALFDNRRYAWLFDDLMPSWTYLTFTQNIAMGVHETFGGQFLGVTWSLAVEEQFYLVAPLSILMLGRKHWVRFLLPLALLAFILRLAFPGFHCSTNTIFRMDALLLGVFVAVLFRHQTAWRLLENQRGVLLSVFAGFLLVTGALLKTMEFGPFEFLWFAILYSTFLLVTLLYRDTRLTWVLRSPLLGFWGSIAYGLYMYHQPISGLLHGWLGVGEAPNLLTAHAASITGLSCVVSTLVAWVSFRTFESWILRIGRRMRYDAIASQ